MLTVFRPIKSDWKTQGYGENLACARVISPGVPVRPFKIVSATAKGTCPVGYESFYPLLGMKGHSGVDNATWHGEPCYFPVDFPEAGGWWGKSAHDSDGGLGFDVVSNNPVTFDGRTGHIKFRFWHWLRPVIQEDQDVTFGELIGYCDSTGASGGDHLHWSMKWCDEDGNALDSDNGYQGAVDFSPWYKNEFVIDVLTERAKLTAIEVVAIPQVQLSLIDLLKSFILVLQKRVSEAKKTVGLG